MEIETTEITPTTIPVKALVITTGTLLVAAAYIQLKRVQARRAAKALVETEI